MPIEQFGKDRIGGKCKSKNSCNFLLYTRIMRFIYNKQI